MSTNNLTIHIDIIEYTLCGMEKSIRELFGLIAADCCLSENNHLRKSPRNYTDPESVISLHKVRLPVAKDKLSITGFFKKKSKHSKNMSFV